MKKLFFTLKICELVQEKINKKKLERIKLKENESLEKNKEECEKQKI